MNTEDYKDIFEPFDRLVEVEITGIGVLRNRFVRDGQS